MVWVRTYWETEISEVANDIINTWNERRIFLFSGQLGTGKTTLIKAICSHLGVEHDMSSPSFGIVNNYKSSKGELFHFDLYRIQNAEELLELGIEEYLDSNSYCFMEWPEIGADIFRSYDAVELQLEQLPDGRRRIFAEK